MAMHFSFIFTFFTNYSVGIGCAPVFLLCHLASELSATLNRIKIGPKLSAVYRARLVSFACSVMKLV